MVPGSRIMIFPIKKPLSHRFIIGGIIWVEQTNQKVSVVKTISLGYSQLKTSITQPCHFVWDDLGHRHASKTIENFVNFFFFFFFGEGGSKAPKVGT